MSGTVDKSGLEGVRVGGAIERALGDAVLKANVSSADSAQRVPLHGGFLAVLLILAVTVSLCTSIALGLYKVSVGLFHPMLAFTLAVTLTLVISALLAKVVRSWVADV